MDFCSEFNKIARYLLCSLVFKLFLLIIVRRVKIILIIIINHLNSSFANVLFYSFSFTGDTLHCVEAGRHKFVFLIKSPLILVTIVESDASVAQIQLQLK